MSEEADIYTAFSEFLRTSNKSLIEKFTIEQIRRSMAAQPDHNFARHVLRAMEKRIEELEEIQFLDATKWRRFWRHVLEFIAVIVATVIASWLYDWIRS